MGQLDKDFGVESYDTRELAWELQQDRPDRARVRMFLDQEADLRGALRLANIQEKDLLKNPAFKALDLQKHLQ